MSSSAESDAGMTGANVAAKGAEQDFSDRRSTPRKRILKAGVIRALPDFEASCVVRDLSEGGAKLKVKRGYGYNLTPVTGSLPYSECIRYCLKACQSPTRHPTLQ